MALSVTVFVTAPRGTGEMGRLLEALAGQLGAPDRLVVLDGTENGPPPDLAPLAKLGKFEHVQGAGESAMHMRAAIGTMTDRDVTIVFEDHAIPSPRFVSEVRRLLAADPEILAIKILGRNETSNDGWGWTNFLLAFADCLHPAIGMPAALLSTSVALRTSALAGAPRTLGAWETQLMPALNRDPRRLAYSNEVWIDHREASNPGLALICNFHNQRAVAAARVAHGHRRGKLAVRAFKDLGLRRPRQIARALAGRDEYRHVRANWWKLVSVCWAAALGAIAGAWLGAGASMRKMH
jgi:hypothetical protein